MINQQTQTLRCDFIHIWALIKEERTVPHIPHTWQKVATKSWGWKKKRRKGKAAPLALDSRHKSCRLDRAHELYSVRYINHIAPDCQGFPCSAQVQQQGFRGPSQTAVPAPVGNYDALHFGLGSLPQSSLWIEPRTIHKWNGSKVRIKYLLWTNSSLLTWTVSSLGAQQAQISYSHYRSNSSQNCGPEQTCYSHCGPVLFLLKYTPLLIILLFKMFSKWSLCIKIMKFSIPRNAATLNSQGTASREKRVSRGHRVREPKMWDYERRREMMCWCSAALQFLGYCSLAYLVRVNLINFIIYFMKKRKTYFSRLGVHEA